MTALTGRQKKDTYKDLLQVSNSNQGIDTTLRTIEDGEGTQGPLQLSTTTLNVTGTFQKSGTTVSATADELNKLASVAAGTTSASKAVVVGANKNLDTLAIADGGLKLGSGAGTAITATAAELNQLIIPYYIADGSAEKDHYVNVGHAGTVSKIYSIIDGAVSTADITVTAKIGSTAMTNGAITIATAGSAAGDKDECSPTALNVFDSPGGAVTLTVTGGGSGGSPGIHIAIVLTR